MQKDNIKHVAPTVAKATGKYSDIGTRITTNIINDDNVNSIYIYLTNTPNTYIDLSFIDNQWVYYNSIRPELIGVAYNVVEPLLKELNK